MIAVLADRDLDVFACRYAHFRICLRPASINCWWCRFSQFKLEEEHDRPQVRRCKSTTPIKKAATKPTVKRHPTNLLGVSICAAYPGACLPLRVGGTPLIRIRLPSAESVVFYSAQLYAHEPMRLTSFKSKMVVAALALSASLAPVMTNAASISAYRSTLG